ncbi:LCP family protein [Cytobacillus sp. FSL W7-1323]|uniref:LCP family protein n=1 Tax=Cytobacillus sp. FSL W7-1323 TaxID=2921700 RepID=UPI0031593B37
MRKYVIILLALLLAACSSGISEKDNRQKEKRTTWNNSEPKTFLLVGVDSRGETDSRSDTIMLARYEPKEERVKLVSIMRDSYVEIPNYEKGYHKLNHAYFLGGTELLSQTIEENFQINIDHSVVIDFKGFANILNTVAPNGLEVDVPAAMIEDMNMNIEPGKNFLNGEQLLDYVRFRHDDEYDYGRVKRQQEVLALLKEELKNHMTSIEGIAKSPEMMKMIMANVDTDLHIDQMFAMATSVLLNPITDIETMRIPVDDSFVDKNSPHAGAVLDMDYEENISALRQFFKEKNVTEVNGRP